MRNLKKVLALVIAFSMMLSVVAFAGYPDVPADADYADAVSLLSALNIIKGDDLGNFNPDNTITRAEFAAVVCRALGLENSATGAAGATSFVDVAADHWASGYINLATQNGIINGYGDGNFGPEDKVTYEQAVKMLVCALGFEPMAAQKGGYPTGYLVVANAYKMTAGVTASVEAPRKTVAKLVYNALSTPKMDQTSFGVNAEWEVLDGKNNREYATLLTDMDIYIASGVVGTYDVADDTITFSIRESSNDYEFGYRLDEVDKKDGYNKIYGKSAATDPEEFDLTLNVNGSDIRNYATQYVDAYVAKDNRGDYDVLAVVPSTMGETLTILSDDLNQVDGSSIEYYVDGTSAKKKIKLDNIASIPYVKNNKSVNPMLTWDAASNLAFFGSDVELKFVEQNGDTSYDMVLVTEYADARVNGIEEDRIKLGNKWVEIDYDKDVEYVLMDAKGAELELADFAEDDVVAIVADDTNWNDAKYLRIIKLTDNVITGTVTEMATQKGKNYVWIDGEKYQDIHGLKQESEGTFYISMTGKIFDFEGTKGISNYAYIIEAAKGGSQSFADDRWEVKLLTVDGGVAEYTLTEDATTDFDTYFTKLGTVDSNDQWLFKNNTASVADHDRLVAFKTNSKGEIKYIEGVTIDDADALVKDVAYSEYSTKTQKIDGKIMEEDVVVFDVTGNNPDSVFATDVSYLVDDSLYGGLVIEVDKEVELFVITAGQPKLSNETGFAIVTEVKTTTVDGEDLVVVDYIQDMTEGQITFNDDSDYIQGTAGSDDYEDLDIGDVIMFNANADGIVSSYAILAKITNGQPVLNTNALGQFDEDNEFIYAYIASEDGGVSKKYENVVVGSDLIDMTLSVSDTTNTYSYFSTNNGNVEIKDSYITNDADWYRVGSNNDTTKDEATFFFARIVDDSLVDIYTFNDRVVGKAAIDAVETHYYKCAVSGGTDTHVTNTDNKTAAAAVDAKIDAIVTPIALGSKTSIEAARTAYNALNAVEKALVKDLADLVAAEKALKPYVDAQVVLDAINALVLNPDAGTGKLTNADEIKAVKDANEAFGKLSTEAKAIVDADTVTKQKLVDAVAILPAE